MSGYASLTRPTPVGKLDVAQRLCGSLQVDIEKARQLLGWTSPLTLDQCLKKAADVYPQSPLRGEKDNWFLRELGGRYDMLLQYLVRHPGCDNTDIVAASRSFITLFCKLTLTMLSCINYVIYRRSTLP